MVKIKSLLKLIKTARFVGGGCICNGCDVAEVHGNIILMFLFLNQLARMFSM